MPTIKQTLDRARQQLLRSDLTAQEADILLSHVLRCNNSHLIAWPEKELSDQQLQTFQRCLNRRIEGEPIAYIKGEKEFWSRSFIVNSHTLIPRPETELLVEFVLQKFSDKTALHIADLGTGSGAIAITLACERPDWFITATDNSEAALHVAEQNAERHSPENIEFHSGFWFDALSARQHIIISNPPYVADCDPHLSQGDVRFEPVHALASGQDGLDDIRLLSQQAPTRLLAGGWLIFEHGYDQKTEINCILTACGFTDIVQLDDYAGLPRLTAGHLVID